MPPSQTVGLLIVLLYGLILGSQVLSFSLQSLWSVLCFWCGMSTEGQRAYQVQPNQALQRTRIIVGGFAWRSVRAAELGR
jgi:hypothetical protein